MDYTEISIRITFPKEIGEIITREKERFVSEYGSKYKSAPHITLYLARYTTDGIPKLITDLKKLTFKKFTLELLGPKMNLEDNRNAYIVDMSNKQEIEELHNQITNVTYGISKESGSWYSHITLGTIPVDSPQPNIIEVEQNLREIIGKQVLVSDITIFVYGKEKDEPTAKLIEEVIIRF